MQDSRGAQGRVFTGTRDFFRLTNSTDSQGDDSLAGLRVLAHETGRGPFLQVSEKGVHVSRLSEKEGPQSQTLSDSWVARGPERIWEVNIQFQGCREMGRGKSSCNQCSSSTTGDRPPWAVLCCLSCIARGQAAVGSALLSVLYCPRSEHILEGRVHNAWNPGMGRLLHTLARLSVPCPSPPCTAGFQNQL